jgi:Ca2+/Na+ antiporter
MALGMSIPELTTNILSCFKSSRIGYGFGAIVGSGVFGIIFQLYRLYCMFWINVSIFQLLS